MTSMSRCFASATHPKSGIRTGWWAWAAVLLALGACADDPLQNAGKNLSVATKEVSFPLTYVGYPTEREVRVVNAARADDRFTVLEADLPFLVEPMGVVKIKGSSEIKLTVQFNPSRPGSYEGVLHVQLGETPVEIPLQGAAEPALVCPSTPCSQSFFDPQKGECVTERFGDGAPCSSADLCLEGTTCQGGLCVGSPRTCEPPNACLVGVCYPEIGCEFIKHDDCEQPANPCREARCDPELGCVERNKEDYTPCGTMSCQEHNICMNGRCEKRTKVEDGYPCSHACGPGGVCIGGKCERPEGDVLVTGWQLQGPSKQDFAIDAMGYLYWLACEGGICALTSHTPNGFERFRTPLLASGMSGAKGLLWVGDAAVVWGATGLDAVEGLGAVRWSRTVNEILEEPPPDPEEPPPAPAGEIFQVIDAGGGRLVVRARWEGGEGLIGLAAASGATDWRLPIEGAATSAITADGEGRIFVVDSSGATVMLRAFDRKGKEDWAVELPSEARILASLPSRLLLAVDAGLEVRNPITGNLLWERPHQPLDLVVSSTNAFLVEAGPLGPRLVGIDLESGDARGLPHELVHAESVSSLLLREVDRAFLLALREDEEEDPAWWLEEYDVQGDRLSACMIPESTFEGGLGILPPSDGGEARLVLRTEEGKIRTFYAPRLGLPPYGWSAEKGSFARGGRPN